jgi:hypothetical protein
MQNDKVRQDFEAWNPAAPCDSVMIHPHSYRVNQRIPFEAGYQAGRAAERAEIVAKLESEELLEQVTCAVRDDSTKHFPATGRAKAAIAKILEVI